MLSMSYTELHHEWPQPSASCLWGERHRTQSFLSCTKNLSFAQLWQHEGNCWSPTASLEALRQSSFGFLPPTDEHRVLGTVYQVATVLRSNDDAKEHNNNPKVFLNHYFTQQPIERGYKVWLTAIFIHLMDFSTLQLGSIPTGRRLFSSVKIINNSYAAVAAICG